MEEKNKRETRESDCGKPNDIGHADLTDLDDEKAYELATRELPEGKRYKSAAMGDLDWWYAVKYFETMEKDRKRHMCVVRSWSKHKQKWVYRCVSIHSLLYCLQHGKNFNE